MLRLLCTLSILMAPVRERLRSEKGLEAIEYALLAALVSAIIVTAVALLNPGMNNIFTAIGNRLTTAGTALTNN